MATHALQVLLIVDGYERTQSSGSYHEMWHPFAATHGRALAANGLGFSTCSNEAIISGAVDLRDFQAVFWVLGDESTTDETFSTTEQGAVQAFLENGGYLFVSGSEIAWDLGEKGTAADKNFLHNYLKIDYESDMANNYAVKGVTGTAFAGMNFSYGVSTSPYPEDFPDTFFAIGGSTPVLRYGNNKIAAIQYAGTIGTGENPAKLMVMGFPFETMTTGSSQNILMRSVLEFFFPQATSVAGQRDIAAKKIYMSQNYPNPFRPGAVSTTASLTQIIYFIPGPARLQFSIIDILGRTIKSWPEIEKAAGSHFLQWDGRDEQGQIVAAGVYFWRMNASEKKNVKNNFQRSALKILVQ